MSSAEAAPGPSEQPGSSPEAAAAARSAPASPVAGFLRQRLAAVAAVPLEQRSHDEAGFLRAHEMLAAAQESLEALDSFAAGSSSCRPGASQQAAASDKQDVHLSVATLTLLGGLEELCSIGVPLQVALPLHSHLLVALMRHAEAQQRRNSEVSTRVAMRFCSTVSPTLQYVTETTLLREDTPLGLRPKPDEQPSPASVLQELHAQLFHDIISRSLEPAMKMMQLFTPHKLPSMAQLQRLWAELCWQWAAQLACGMGRPSWMADYLGPTRAEAQQLQLQALAAMRQLRPNHPQTTCLAAQTELAGLLPAGPSALKLVRRGLQQAAAAGGPHGSSMFTAEFAYGLISSSAPTANTPPWGCLALSESAQLLERADAALVRCKALPPPAYLTGLKALRDNASVRWRRAAVQRHQQAGANEWRKELLAAETAPAVSPGQLFARMMSRAGDRCAGCGCLSLELHSCSACKVAKYCRCGLCAGPACGPWGGGRDYRPCREGAKLQSRGGGWIWLRLRTRCIWPLAA